MLTPKKDHQLVTKSIQKMTLNVNELKKNQNLQNDVNV